MSTCQTPAGKRVCTLLCIRLASHIGYHHQGASNATCTRCACQLAAQVPASPHAANTPTILACSRSAGMSQCSTTPMLVTDHQAQPRATTQACYEPQCCCQPLLDTSNTCPQQQSSVSSSSALGFTPISSTRLHLAAGAAPNLRATDQSSMSSAATALHQCASPGSRPRNRSQRCQN
jgi:hypothetical protein